MVRRQSGRYIRGQLSLAAPFYEDDDPYDAIFTVGLLARWRLTLAVHSRDAVTRSLAGAAFVSGPSRGSDTTDLPNKARPRAHPLGPSLASTMIHGTMGVEGRLVDIDGDNLAVGGADRGEFGFGGYRAAGSRAVSEAGARCACAGRAPGERGFERCSDKARPAGASLVSSSAATREPARAAKGNLCIVAHMRLNHITLPVSSVPDSVEFYVRLGLTQIVANYPTYARLLAPDGDTTLSLHQADAPTKDGVSIHFEVDDVDRTVQCLKQAGFEFVCGPVDQPYLWREAILLDPDGHRIFIFCAGENRIDPPWRLHSQGRRTTH